MINRVGFISSSKHGKGCPSISIGESSVSDVITILGILSLGLRGGDGGGGGSS